METLLPQCSHSSARAQDPRQSFGMPGLEPQSNRTSAPRVFVEVCALIVDVDNRISAGQPDLAPLISNSSEGSCTSFRCKLR